MDAAIWRPFWVSVFLDLPAATFDTAAAFWAAVTGFPLSARRGDDLEFATLVPGEGDAYLRVQRVRDANPRLHLDVHVTDVGAAAAHAVELGAEPVADAGLGYRVLCSPGGLVFCLVRHTSRTRPAPTAWPDGHRSVVDQVALDLTLEVHAVESAFWAALLDQPVQQLGRDEFSTIDLRPELPLRFLLQRLDERTGPARAHLDLSADDVAAEVARHWRWAPCGCATTTTGRCCATRPGCTTASPAGSAGRPRPQPGQDQHRRGRDGGGRAVRS